jgi:osmotically inducible lipoprotein OsmB
VKEQYMNRLGMIVALAALAGLAACTNMAPPQQGTMSGAGIGAATGAGIAAISGGNAWTGAAIGGVAGGVAGNIRGSNQQ